MVDRSSALQLLTTDDTVSEDLQGPMNLIREQREDVLRLAALHLAALESVRNHSAVASVTPPQRSSTLGRLRAKNAQLGGEAGRLSSDVGAFETLCDALEVF